MKEENKKEIRKNVLAGAGTAAGAAIGAVVENALRSEAAEAEETVDAEVVAVAAEAPAEHEETTPTFAAAPVELDEVVVVAQAVAHPAAQHAEPEQPIMAVATPQAPAVSEDTFDDIVVVSQGSEPHADAFEIKPPTTAATAPEGIAAESTHEVLVAAVADPMGVPDYMAEDFAEKADSIVSGITDIDSIDMPDYINNANIDSFTEPV